MEKFDLKKWIARFSLKKNWIFIAGIAGILLIFFSDVLGNSSARQKAQPSSDTMITASAYVEQVEVKLEKMICEVAGAGKTRVMVTLETQGETVYAQNDQSSTQEKAAENGASERQTSRQSDHVIVNGSNGDAPLVEMQLVPCVQGVAVVCEGGDNITVVKRITDLVSVVLGLSTNRICVTKMI